VSEVDKYINRASNAKNSKQIGEQALGSFLFFALAERVGGT